MVRLKQAFGRFLNAICIALDIAQYRLEIDRAMANAICREPPVQSLPKAAICSVTVQQKAARRTDMDGKNAPSPEPVARDRMASPRA